MTSKSRPFIAAFLSIFFGYIPLGYSFGLGEITSKSYISQPLNAEIEIFLGNINPENEVIIELASKKAHEKSGIKSYQRNKKLRFNLEINSEKKGTIKVSTKNSVREPFYNFIINVQTPNSKTMREYEILIDPPH